MLGNGILQWSIAGNFPRFHIICCFMNRFQTFETNKILFPVPLSKKLKVNVWLFEKFDSFFCVYINLQQPDSEWLVGNLISVALGQLWEFGNRFCSIKWFTVAPFSHERLWIRCCQRVTVCTCQSNPCCQRTSCTSRSTQKAGSSSLHHPADITTSKLLCCSTFRGVCAQGSGALTTKKDLPRNRNADTHIALHANFFVYSEKHRFKLLIYTLLCMNEDWRGSQTELRVKMIVWICLKKLTDGCQHDRSPHIFTSFTALPVWNEFLQQVNCVRSSCCALQLDLYAQQRLHSVCLCSMCWRCETAAESR